MTDSTRSNVRHALRVAGTATAIVALVYLVVIVVFDVVVGHRLISQVDSRLTDQLAQAVDHPDIVPSATRPEPGGPALHPAGGGDPDDAPIFLWVVGPNGTVINSTVGAPTLRLTAWRRGTSVSSKLGSSQFRLDSISYHGGWLVTGVSLATQNHIQGLLVLGEGLAGPIALVGMFLGSLVIGVKASAPVERARRRQLEFTADASHELRTPLTVIGAEVDLALRKPRDAASYRQALERVGEESGRLSYIVENLLWLARFDSNPPPPTREPIDLGTIAEVCVARFQPLAEARGLRLTSELQGGATPWVNAPAEWIDRLTGVLVDNACRYAPDGGHVRVAVEASNGRVKLVVEDSGPGVPVEERPQLFDRFHRATDVPGGTGLGLAIADSIVRSTDGRWHVGDSSLGGALFEVSWTRHGDRGRDLSPRSSAAASPIDRGGDGDRAPERPATVSSGASGHRL